MLTQEKIKSIKKQLRSGMPEGEIKNQLKEEGYTEQEIAEIFAPHKYDMSSWYVFFGIAFILGGIYLLIKKNEYWLHVLLTGLGLIIVNFNEERKRKK
ncbi:MAG: LPXTG cell wall anchor domain-containing protein [Bacteroidota bacterium]